MKRIVLAACAAVALALPATASAAKRPSGDFVGKTGKLAIGVVVDRSGVIAYICDGKSVGDWHTGKGLGRLGSGPKALTLKVRGSSLVARFRGREVTLRAATGRAGLYRAERRRNGQRELAGWVVQRRGGQVGVRQTGSTVVPAPTLSVTSLTAGSLVAGHLVTSPGANQLPVIDLDGDGVDLSGQATTALAGGTTRSVRWTRPGDDDAFLALDKAALEQAGYKLTLADGSAAPAFVLARGGLRITRGTTSTTATNGFHLLRLLDANGDGRVKVGDPAFAALRAFNDGDGDGSRDIGEGVRELQESGVDAEGIRLFVQQTRLQNIQDTLEYLTAIAVFAQKTAVKIIGNIAA